MTKERNILMFYKQYRRYKRSVTIKALRQYWIDFRFLNKIIPIINKHVKPSGKVLDVGCGYTSLLELLPQKNKVGIDIVIDLLRKNKFPLNKEIKWINASAENLPFENEKFSMVSCSNGIDHHDEPTKSLSEMLRVLKKGGLLLLTIDVFDKDKGYRDKKHPHSYTEEKINRQLKGLEILFKRKSIINAQFHRYMRGSIITYSDKKELIILAKKS